MHVARLLGGVNRQTTAFWKALIMYLPLAHPNIVEYEQYWGTPDGGRGPGVDPSFTYGPLDLFRTQIYSDL